MEELPARRTDPTSQDTKKVTAQVGTLTTGKGFQSIYQEMHNKVQSNSIHNSQKLTQISH